MEAFNKILEAGKRMIWGDNNSTPSSSGEEPISGVAGAGTILDPYDGGNREGM